MYSLFVMADQENFEFLSCLCSKPMTYFVTSDVIGDLDPPADFIFASLEEASTGILHELDNLEGEGCFVQSVDGLVGGSVLIDKQGKVHIAWEFLKGPPPSKDNIRAPRKIHPTIRSGDRIIILASQCFFQFPSHPHPIHDIVCFYIIIVIQRKLFARKSNAHQSVQTLQV